MKAAIPLPTLDPLSLWLIPTQEWETFTLQTLEQTRDAEPVNNPVDNEE